MNEPKTPLWETLIMAGSFIALWAWWLARQARAQMAGGLPANPLPMAWNGLLIIALGALLVVLVNRMARVQKAMRENLGKPPMPFGVPPIPRHGGETHGKGQRNGGPKKPTL